MNWTGKKILIACYSRSGNTRAIAEMIHAQTGGDLFEVEMMDPYSTNDQECHNRAEREMEGKNWPPLATEVECPDSYDVLFVGYPIWWSTMSPPLFTFFEKYNFAGKTVVPFCTYGGSGPGRGAEDIAALAPGAEILEVLGVKTSDVKDARDDVAAWLGKMEVAERK